MDHNFRNVLFMSISFWFVWLAFFSQSLIEEDVINKYSESGKVNKHAGYISLAICFAAETLADPFAATLVNRFEAKWTMILGAITSAIFTSGFLYLNEYVLYITSALFGFGSAALWVGQGNYLALNSNEKTAAKHSAIFFAFFKSGLIMAGILLLAVDKIFNKSQDLSYSSIKILYGVFTAVALLGAVLFAFLPAPKNKKMLGEIDKPKLSTKEMLKSTLSVFLMKDMILLSITSAYIGIQWCFWLSVFPTCVAFTKTLGNENDKPVMLALCVIFQGIGQVGAALACIYMSMKLPKLRPKILTTVAIFIQLLMFGLVFLMFPKMSSLDNTYDESIIKPIVPLTYVIPFFLGIGDVMLKSPMYTLIIRKLPGKSAEAFALFNFYQSLTCSTAFFYSTSLNLYWQLGILVVTAVIGGICVIIVDRRPKKIALIHSMAIFSNDIKLEEKSYIEFDEISLKSVSGNLK